MQLPKVGDTYSQERLGIAALQTYAARRHQIWRETGSGDVGIDGNLEFVDPDGYATGRIVAVQVKSGQSYFSNKLDHGWKFYPQEKHRRYWESSPLPVLLVLHDPNRGVSYWSDVRQALRSPGRDGKPFIEVSALKILENTHPTELFETAGVQNQPYIEDLDEVLAKLLNTCSKEASFPLSHFDLFVYGLTNLCRSIYYGMDMVCHAVEYNLDKLETPWGMGMGDNEHRFVFDFVKFLVAQGLAQIDYADCLIDWVDREMQPHFVAPLTSRGRALVALIGQKEARLVAEGKLPNEDSLRVAQDGLFAMVPLSYAKRSPRIKEFQVSMATR